MTRAEFSQATAAGLSTSAPAVPSSIAATASSQAGACEPVNAVYCIAHDIPGRMRLRPRARKEPSSGLAAFLLETCPHLRGEEIHVSAKTGSVLLLYAAAEARQELRAAFAPRPGKKIQPGNKRRKRLQAHKLYTYLKKAAARRRRPAQHRQAAQHGQSTRPPPREKSPSATPFRGR